MSKENNLHGWLFTKNTYTGNWNATHRENYNALWNERNNGVLSSPKIDVLIELISKTNGDNLKIEKIING